MPEFNTWFPDSRHGDPAINVMDFGAIADGGSHPLYNVDDPRTGVPYANLAAAQLDYPSATSTSDYADWCALTEAIKAAFTTDGVKHGSEGWKNRPLRIPVGRYNVNRPVELTDIANAWIYGTGGYAQIYNETTVEPNNIALKCDGFCFSRVENLSIGAVGTNAIALDINKTAAATLVNTNSNLWLNVNMSATGTNSVGCSIGRGGLMCSEQTFIRCINDYSDYGWVISNPNALSYVFITSGGTDHKESCIRVNTGGCVTCINCFFGLNGVDIDNYASGPVTAISCRSESRKFIRGGARTTITGCTQSSTSSECVLIETSGIAFITGTDCAQSRVEGEGEFQIEGGLFQHAGYYITAISNSGGLVKITHPTFGYLDWEHWRNGDQVKITGVTGTTNPDAPSVNGVWIINKLNATSFELVGSNYVTDTYNASSGRMGPGPDYATQGLVYARPTPTVHRPSSKACVRNTSLSWFDSGSLITNSGAAGSITITLPNPSESHWVNCRGTVFRFVVIAAQSLTIVVSGVWAPPIRIFRAGGYATGGTQIASNVVGNSIELMLVDGQGAGPGDTTVDAIGHRWLVISETGTWTLSGTP